MSSLKLEIASQSDIPTLVSIIFASFQNPFSLSAFPDTPSVRKWWVNMFNDEIKDEHAIFLKVTDEKTGELVACAKWNEPVDGQEPEITLPEFGEGINRKTVEALLPKLATLRKQNMGKRGHWCKSYSIESGKQAVEADIKEDLELLGTLPSHQRKGAGSLLMEYALSRADATNREAYLEASPEGRPLYERFGFVERDVVEIDTEFGPYKNLCMIRHPKARD